MPRLSALSGTFSKDEDSKEIFEIKNAYLRIRKGIIDIGIIFKKILLIMQDVL